MTGQQAAATQPAAKQYDYGLGETVEVTLRGTIVERKDGPTGDHYWVEQVLPDGRKVRQWFKSHDVYPVEVAV